MMLRGSGRAREGQMSMVSMRPADVVFLRRLRRADKSRAAAQVLADEHWLRLRLPLVIALRGSDGWSVQALAGPMPSSVWTAPIDSETKAWLAEETIFPSWRRHDIHDQGRPVARAFFGGLGNGPVTRALCELAAPFLTVVPQARRDRQLVLDMAQFVHDFQQPLATLMLSLQMMDPSPAQRGHAERCLRSVAQQRDLLAELPLLVGGGPAPADPVVLEELLTDVLDDVRVPAQDKGVRLSLRRQVSAVLLGARSSLRRAFGNVVLNAVQITPPNTPVKVTLRRAWRGVAVDVHDCGPGLAPTLREQSFEPFVSRRPGGTGLGLAVARAVTEAHGGWVQFVDGEGGRVRFSFPRAQVRPGRAKLDE
jgi:signal transduction histidine kinase